MSLFRKPKKIQRRVFCADDDDDDDAAAEPQPPPPPIISKKKENRPAKTTQLLSFVDEVEEEEVFKVKKSKHSSRLSKKREKEKQKGPDGDNYINDNTVEEEQPINIERSEKKPKKKVTLEGLILSGREALAADGAGDLSDSPGEEQEVMEEDSRGFHRYRAENVRAALAGASGHIPDAALIHAARKTRQQARELGGDYIPVRSESAPGSRLARDDDGSGDDDDDGRIEVRGLELPSDKPKRGTAVAPTNEELDSEPDEWEAQQVKKAMSSMADFGGNNGVELNPFALPPPPPPPSIDAHLRPLSAPGAPPPATAQELADALRQRLQELKVERDAAAAQAEAVREALLSARRVRERCEARRAALAAAYRRAQAVRGYLTDLVECLDEKMPELEALEARALAMHRRHCEFLLERRRADVRDQAQDVMALAARPGAVKPLDTEEKIRRTAEREGRRRARRLAREASAAAAGSALRHRDGDSSDDSLPPAESQHCRQEREAIRAQSAQLFADALPAWRGVRGVCARLARWRRRAPALYAAAYLPDTLPRLLAPYVRHQLILWNPLADEDNEDYERMEWFQCLMMYGVRPEKLSSDSEDSDMEEGAEGDAVRVSEHGIREDPDLFLVPTLVTKVLLPKVTELVEHSWDPMSVRACIRLRQLAVRVAALPGGAPALARLGAAVRARLTAALHADVFLPALPPQLMETSGGLFWRRCLGAGVRLLRAALALTAPPAVLRAESVVHALVETLCTAAGAAPPQYMSSAAAALASSLPRSGELRARALRRVAALAQRALARLQSDNPLHLKALEQARAVVAEAKALE